MNQSAKQELDVEQRGQGIGEAIAGVFELMSPEVGDRHLPKMFDKLRGQLPTFIRSYLATQDMERACRAAWPWRTDAAGGCVDDEQMEHALDLGRLALLDFGVKQVSIAYLERAACPDCGARRTHEEAMGRIFWHECADCVQRQRVRAHLSWRAETLAAWERRALALIGETHWPREVGPLRPVQQSLVVK